MSRQSILDKLTLNHETQIKKTLEDLEAQIISDIAEHKKLLSTQPFSPELLRQKTAITIKLRNDFKKQFQSIFLAESDSLIREYDQVVGGFMKEFGKLDIPDKFKNLTKVDLDTINALKEQTFKGFEEVANTYLTEINTNVYQNVIGGRSFEDMVKDISGKLTGGLDAAGRPMSSHAGQLAHDSIMQFDAQFVKAKASSAGLTHFKYAGTAITTTRDFCQRHIGRVYSEEEIRSIWSDSWTGKSSGDPFVVRGGYRCRHTWNPVDPDWLEKEEKKKEEKPKKILDVPKGRIKASQLKPITHTTLINTLSKGFKESANDKRYVKNPTTKQPVLKFNGSQKLEDYGVANIKTKEIRTKFGRKITYEYSEKDYAAINVLTNEINDLCKKYNVQNLRGYKRMAKSNAIADMGDGVMGLNIKFLRLDGQAISPKSTWKFGDSVNAKPFSSSSYFDDPLDKIRSTFYHELGHHIHQQKFVKTVDDYMKPLIERKMLGKIIKNKSATRYANKNQQEWFAENFSLYHMDREDLVDPEWIKFFKENVDV